MKRVAMDKIRPMTGPEIRTGTLPSIFFAVYIETSRIEQWDYMFNEPVEKKEIQKGFEVKKQLHLASASHRLIYRFELSLTVLCRTVCRCPFRLMPIA
jgi:hypothetical protein